MVLKGCSSNGSKGGCSSNVSERAVVLMVLKGAVVLKRAVVLMVLKGL